MEELRHRKKKKLPIYNTPVNPIRDRYDQYFYALYSENI